MKVKEAKERSSAFRPDRKRKKQSGNDRPRDFITCAFSHSQLTSESHSIPHSGQSVLLTKALEWLSKEVS